SLHGPSVTARSLTFAGWPKEHGPLPGGSQAIVAPYCYRCPLRQTFPACNYACLDTSFELIDAQSTGRPAAVLTEPLFSAGGVIEPPPGWLARLHELCRERGMLLILDEEQTGLGKLGTMFACDAEGVVPDMITVAKHFGGGISISAVSTTEALGQKVHRYCFERGLIFSQRRRGSVLRFVPPMSTSEEQLDRAAQLLDDGFAASLQT